MLGIKYRRTLEKGDILVAKAVIKIYELQEDNSLKVVDNAIKSDTIGYFTGSIVKFDGSGIQYVEFVTPDSTMGDGSPDFSRIPLYFDWEDAMDYLANPKYNYPDRSANQSQTSIVALATEWVDSNSRKILWVVGILSIGTLLINLATYFIKKKKSQPKLKPIRK
ncbi:hypothetical protein [Emticicia sp. BO119]|uniref:hypothetical protein n=1 Tax=Emticicia sp. BO119 TaxID=2757768 RepID=UPI0015F0C316|nr:hypothetical protein [Emticicia sp. BO119]MBA4849035.1 hypothetical protein [Emticicia sp. BO119]